MAKFNKEQRQIIGANVVAAIKNSGNAKRVMVYCSSEEGGQLVASTIQAVYKYKATKSENIFSSVIEHTAWAALGSIGTAIGIGRDKWKDFSVNTGSKSNSDKLVTEINSCITEYGGTAGTVDPSLYAGSDTGASGGGSGISKTTLFVIVGAVLAIVLAIVLTRKKK